MSTLDQTGCTDCAQDTDHCHAVWLRHRDGHEECLAVECRTDAGGHVFVLACAEVDPGCCP